MSKPRRPPPTPRKADRPRSDREPAVRLYLFAEGATEDGWATALHRACRELRVELHCTGQAGVPQTLLNKAKAKAAELRRAPAGTHTSRDEVWVVFDRDAHPGVPQTLQEACDAGVGVVFSNACFELWPLLHLADLSRHTERDDLQRQLHERHPGYHHDRGARVDWPSLAGAADQAAERAVRLHRRAHDAGDALGNPTTTAWLLHRRCLCAREAESLLEVAPPELRGSLRRCVAQPLRDRLSS